MVLQGSDTIPYMAVCCSCLQDCLTMKESLCGSACFHRKKKKMAMNQYTLRFAALSVGYKPMLYSNGFSLLFSFSKRLIDVGYKVNCGSFPPSHIIISPYLSRENDVQQSTNTRRISLYLAEQSHILCSNGINELRLLCQWHCRVSVMLITISFTFEKLFLTNSTYSKDTSDILFGYHAQTTGTSCLHAANCV